MTVRALGKLVLVALAWSWFTGCAEEKLTFERWQTIHSGQSPEAVEQCLGEPWQKMSDRWIYEDTEDHVSAKIYFDSDGAKVICKQWYDPDHGWHGRNPDELGETDAATGEPSSTGSGTID